MIDTHAHILDERFDDDRDAALTRARAAGVDVIIEVGCAPDQWQKALDFAGRHPGIACLLGIHPQDAAAADEAALNTLEQLCARNAVAGIGETGLDYHFETAPRARQQESFLRHIAIARKLSKPLCIHCREAYPDMLAILARECSRPGTLTGVVHCFSGSLAEARSLTDMGFLLGIDGPVTYPSAKTLKEAVAAMPLASLILETDCPYLPPQEYRGQRNEPAYLPLIAREVARLKNISPETVESVTTATARRLFRLPEAATPHI